jgi:hypothetical protein
MHDGTVLPVCRGGQSSHLCLLLAPGPLAGAAAAPAPAASVDALQLVGLQLDKLHNVAFQDCGFAIANGSARTLNQLHAACSVYRHSAACEHIAVST